jgi:hypothetical protein
MMARQSRDHPARWALHASAYHEAAPAAFREGALCRGRRRPAMTAGPLFSAAPGNDRQH